jgi:hypothetical protein
VVVCCFLAVISMSCSENNCCCPEQLPPTSGRAIVEAVVRTDQDGTRYFSGFSFSEGRVVRVPNREGILPDLMLLLEIVDDGQAAEVFFIRDPHLGGGFHHIASIDTWNEAQAVFDSTTCIPEGAGFNLLGFSARPYDVFAIRTTDGRFAKVIVVDAFAVKYESVRAETTFVRYYGEATFDWVFQPDGGRCFD